MAYIITLLIAFLKITALKIQIFQIEIRLGHINIRFTPRVSFYVHKTQRFTPNNGKILFEMATLNEGNAMNLPSGVFTAKKMEYIYSPLWE